MNLIIQTKTKQVKNPTTKTTYLTEGVTKELLTSKQYDLTTNKGTLKWFRRLGGSETAQRCYTSQGYNVYKLSSVSPDRQFKTIRKFEFLSLDYKDAEVFKNIFKEYKDGLFYLKRFKGGKTFKEVQTIVKSKI